LAEKDKRNKKSSEKHPADSPGVLDRRARKAEMDAPRDLASSAPRRPLSAEAFQETLTRYCRRAQKDGREFCVASLSVLEYKKASNLEKEQLDKAVVNVLLKFLRAEDRICFIEPAHYLILTPYTSFEDANKAMKRVAEKISHSKIRVKADFIYPSAFVKVVSSALRTSEEKGETVIDCESIYNSIGYTFDGKGRLRFIEDTEDQHNEPLFGGNLEGWLERYKSDKDKRMHDRWSENALVELRELAVVDTSTAKNATNGSAISGHLLRRLRVLQNIDHPGINKLLDFYAKKDGTLLIVTYPPDGVELTEMVCRKSFKTTTEKLVSWLQQILNALIALQTLAPPVVPASFSNIKVFHLDDGGNDGRIVLTNYESDYLLAAGFANSDVQGALAESCENEGNGGTKAKIESRSQTNKNGSGSPGLLLGLIEFIVQLAEQCAVKDGIRGKDGKDLVAFLTGLDANALSSPHKLRTQLKHFAEN
jgi:GGDEF domain-containing protein